MPQIDPVILQLQADLKQYQAGLTGAQRLTETKLAAIEARGMAMGQNLKKGFSLAQGAALGFVAAIGVDAVIQAAQKGLEYASSLGEVAQQLGVSTDALQEYRYAATQAGLSQEEMDQALTQLTRRIGEAAGGTKTQAEAFTKLGVSVKDAEGNILDAGEAIPKIADALKGVESPAERAAILMDLFGKSGQKLEPLLSGGSAAVNELRDAAHSLGIVLSEEQIQRADDTAHKLAKVSLVLSTRIAGVVSDNADSIVALANSLAFLVDKAFAAAKSVQAFQLRMFAFSESIVANNPLYSAQERADAGKKRDQLRQVAARLDGTADTTGSFRDYGVAPIKGATVAGGSAPSSGGAPASSRPSGSGGASGPSAAEIAQRAAQDEARFQDELGRLRVERLRSEADYTESTAQRFEAVIAAIDEELASYTRQVSTDDSLTEAKRQRLIAEKTAVLNTERANAEQDRQREIATKAAELGIAELQAQSDILDAKAELATGSKARLAFELELLDLNDRIRRAELDRVLATEATSSAQWQRAKIERDALDASSKDRRAAVMRDNASPLEAYRTQLQNTQDNLGDEAEKLIVSELEHIRGSMRGALSDLIGTDDPLLNGLLDLLIQNVIIKPLADALAGASGGSGGGLGGFLTSVGGALFGRASGGRVNAGQMVRVNEGSSPGRVEGFIPQGAGHIVPLGRMNALKSGVGGKVFNIMVDARNSVTPDGFAQQLSGQILQQAAAMDGQTAKAVLGAAPGRMSQYQRDGF